MRASQIVVAVLALMVAFANQAQAALIVGGTGFVSQADANQLESWLGEGPITITNIYTKQSGDSSFNFHVAADGNGRTFSVIEVLGGYNAFTGEAVSPQVIGGYNPQSWDSVTGWHSNFLPGFLFNLTTNEKQDENTYLPPGFQTYNNISYGPTFGAGHDIYVDFSLTNGYAFNYSYGGTSYVNAITSGYNNYDIFTIGRLEIYTISGNEAAVPEPSSMILLGLGGLGVGLAVWRPKRQLAVA
jgi:hypothetical protein